MYEPRCTAVQPKPYLHGNLDHAMLPTLNAMCSKWVCPGGNVTSVLYDASV